MLASTTDFILLSQKVSLLESYFGWIIGGVTLTITILVALFVVIQYFYGRSIQKNEIRLLEEKLQLKIISSIDSKAIDLRSFVEQSFEDVQKKIKLIEDDNKIENSRLLALAAENLKSHDMAFFWWLKSASFVFKNNGLDVVKRLNFAKECLVLYEGKNSTVKEHSDEIQIIFDSIEKKYRIEIKDLRSEFTKRILNIVK